ncbi:MAG: hypothetical protein GX638_06375, partial [Crenarchaeota archaeon]|nr:hypothetical protein [Thermoproteota archaeon]
SPVLKVSVDDANLATPEIISTIVAVKGKILFVNVFQPSLEETYLKLIMEQKA